MKKTTLLIIEDDFLIQHGYKKNCPKGINLLQAFTLEEAEKIITEQGKNINIIAFDGELDKKGTNTIELIKKTKTWFKGIMIATSSNGEILEYQLKSGCGIGLIDKLELYNTILKEGEGKN